MKQRQKAKQYFLFHYWIFKNPELETKHQTYEGRVVLRGDIVKDDSGSGNSSSASCPQTMSKRTQDKIFNGAKFERIELPEDTQRSWSMLESYSSCGKDSNQNDAASSSQARQSDVTPTVSAEKFAASEINPILDLLARAGKPAATGSDIVDVDSEWPNKYLISAASVPHLEKVHSNLQRKIGRKSGRRHERPRYEFVDMENVYVCYVRCSTPSWQKLFGDFAFYRKPGTTNDEAIVRRVTKNWLVHTSWAKDNSVD